MYIFDPEFLKGLFQTYFIWFLLVVFAASIFLVQYLIPKVLWVVREKDLYKTINERSVHTKLTPTFGGVAFFITFIIMVSLLQSFYDRPTGNHLIAASTLVFMAGLKDDLVISTARVKLFGQLVAAMLIAFAPDMQVSEFHGFLGIQSIPDVLGGLFSIFIILSVVNAYNLIDGIDGLAAGVGIVIAGLFTLVFFMADSYFLMLLCAIVVGILLGYLPFNYSKNDKRIFMGDSGSLTMGLILGFLTLKIINLNISEVPNPIAFPENRLLLVLSILFIPTFDTIRVIMVRLLKGDSPFEADNNHTHHLLLKMGYSHKKTTLILCVVNVTMVVLVFVFAEFLNTLWLGLSLLLLYGVIFIGTLIFERGLDKKRCRTVLKTEH